MTEHLGQIRITIEPSFALAVPGQPVIRITAQELDQVIKMLERAREQWRETMPVAEIVPVRSVRGGVSNSISLNKHAY